MLASTCYILRDVQTQFKTGLLHLCVAGPNLSIIMALLLWPTEQAANPPSGELLLHCRYPWEGH